MQGSGYARERDGSVTARLLAQRLHACQQRPATVGPRRHDERLEQRHQLVLPKHPCGHRLCGLPQMHLEQPHRQSQLGRRALRHAVGDVGGGHELGELLIPRAAGGRGGPGLECRRREVAGLGVGRCLVGVCCRSLCCVVLAYVCCSPLYCLLYYRLYIRLYCLFYCRCLLY